jgi:opacity protein-like surface antigen
MSLKPQLEVALAIILTCVTCSVRAQVVQSATQKITPIAIGAGLSAFNNPDFGPGHILGGTLWIDYTPNRMPWHLRGIGLEAEARDLNYGRSPTVSPMIREDTAEGGVIYSWPRYHKIRPYGKLMLGYGNADYPIRSSPSHPTGAYNQSRTITCGGGGVEFRVLKSLWVRADYEYQSWPDFFKHKDTTIPAGRLDPQGFTLGVMYHISRPHF